jgi:hypothetical protein
MTFPELHNFTTSDWMNAKHFMTANAFKKMIKTAKAGGIQIPSVLLPDFNPRITFISASDTAMYQRVKDVEAVGRFNKAILNWSNKVETELKASAQTMFKHRKRNVSEEFPRLSDSIKANVRFDKQYKLEANSVGFSFARHGVYQHYGAGKGYGGLTGSKWTDKYSRLKQTNALSMGAMGTGARDAVHWFNPVIKNNIKELENILAEYSVDIVLNLNSILLPE